MSQPILYLCINLPDCEIRRQSMDEQSASAGIDLCYVPAVEGRNEEPAREGLQIQVGKWDWKGFRLSGAQQACLLSHRRCLKHFLAQEEYDYCVIFEDDASFTPELTSQLTELMGYSNWDAIKIENRRPRRGFGLTTTSWGSEVIVGTKSVQGTTAILWTRSGAQKVLATFDPLLLPFDVHLAHYVCHRLRILELSPSIVTQMEFDSNISPNPSQAGSHKRKTLGKLLGQSFWSYYRLSRAFLTWLRLRGSFR